ncbi:MAG: hypothetical protein KAX49_19170 [Halanaerobiales bacterium]|nr:hypothetical protein [Halanaerobiales bacterium]
MNVFRLATKDLEDSETGSAFPDITQQNPPVTISGAILARVVEIINGYTISFEELDYSYRVEATNANTNIGDVQNVSNVSLSTSNSAGLQDLSSMQAASFGGGVAVDTTSAFSTTVYPTGTRQNPVNNMASALLIAQERGFRTFFILGDLPLTTLDYSNGYIFLGDNAISSSVTIEDAANVTECEFRELSITGILDNNNIVRNCSVSSLTHVNGFIYESAISGTITLAGGIQASLLNCFSGVAGGDVSQTAIVDMGGSGQSMVMRNYSGGIKVINRTGVDAISIDLVSGQAVIDSTVVAGEITVRGVGVLTNNGVGTSTVNTEALINKANITDAVWNATASSYHLENTMGEIQYHQAFAGSVYISVNDGQAGTTGIIGTREHPVNNTADALVIAAAHGLNTLKIDEDVTFGATDVIDGLNIIGSHAVKSQITLTAGVSTTFTHFQDCFLTGTVDGDIIVRDSMVEDLVDFRGLLHQTMLLGTVTLTGIKTSYILDCHSAVGGVSTPSIDFNGVENNGLVIRNYNGGVKFENKEGDADVSVDLNSGHLNVNGTVINGLVLVRGVGKLTDTSGGLAVVDSTNLLSQDGTGVVGAVWDELIADHTLTGSTGEALLAALTRNKFIALK